VECAVEFAVRTCLREAGARASDRIAVGFSGGVDSTALLASLCALGGPRPLAIFVDHALRPEAERDREVAIVREACRELVSGLVIARIKPGAIARRAEETGAGIEATARAFRYAAFERTLNRSGCAWILVAHTRDDQAETLLMRILGGSATEGLRGIPATKGPVLRPFLQLPKVVLAAYVADRGLAHSEDSTNASQAYLRNKIRLTLIPVLDSSFPGWRTGLDTTARSAMEDAAALSLAAARMAFVSAKDDPKRLVASAEALLGAPDAIAVRVILKAASRLTGRDRLSRRAAIAALAALRCKSGKVPSSRSPGASDDSPLPRCGCAYSGWGIVLSFRGHELIMERGLDFPLRGGYFVKIDGPCRIAAGHIRLCASWARNADAGIRADAFRFPLVVRSRRPGDSLALPGGGSRRVDELFSEWGLSAALRGSVPIVEDRDGIAAVLGSAAGAKDRYRPSSASGEARRLSIRVKGA
jgi:tRNA(Ile)-lysidine synthase